MSISFGALFRNQTALRAALRIQVLHTQEQETKGTQNDTFHDPKLQKEIGKVAKESHLYETEPWGNTTQDAYLNQVIMVNTTLEPRDLLNAIARVERYYTQQRMFDDYRTLYTQELD